MKPYLFILLISVFGFKNNETLHPVHFSVTNMEYNEQNKEFDISIKLFADDFEKIVNRNYNVVLNLKKENPLKDYEKYINKYIKTHLIIIFDKKNTVKKIKLHKISVKNNKNSVWLYYKIKSKKPHKVIIRNLLMTDLYKDQKNLFIFTVGKFQEAKKFEKNDTDLQFVVK